MTPKKTSVVRDLMSSELVTLMRNDALSLADDVMRLGRIRHMPVIDEDGELTGIVSQRDMLHGALASVLGYGTRGRTKLLQSLLVKEVMTGDPTTTTPDTSLRDAAKIMTRQKIGCLPVVDGGKLVGILTESDFVFAFINGSDAE
jgi:CBS domain-containing membrane protein